MDFSIAVGFMLHKNLLFLIYVSLYSPQSQVIYANICPRIGIDDIMEQSVK